MHTLRHHQSTTANNRGKRALSIGTRLLLMSTSNHAHLTLDHCNHDYDTACHLYSTTTRQNLCHRLSELEVLLLTRVLLSPNQSTDFLARYSLHDFYTIGSTLGYFRSLASPTYRTTYMSLDLFNALLLSCIITQP